LVTASFALFSYAQNSVRVKGKITDESGNAMAGVSVMVKGTTKGVLTDPSGNFEISAPSNATLVFSSLGFASKEVKLNGETSINVSLAADTKELENVVVVGYGTQRREAITGSVVSISGDRMREVPSANISQALQGRLAGVEMSQTSTRPGATMQIRIRGTRSLSADNNPLIVLDGIPFIGSLADLNPNDIKSVEVLKDASATAIYGSRGANGVILITTEKGTKNGKPRISYSSYVGTQEVFAKYPMMDGPKFVALRTAAKQYTHGQDEFNDINTDWQDLFYKTGLVTDHNLSLSGGTETGSDNFGIGCLLKPGVLPTIQNKPSSVRGSVAEDRGQLFRFSL